MSYFQEGMVKVIGGTWWGDLTFCLLYRHRNPFLNFRSKPYMWMKKRAISRIVWREICNQNWDSGQVYLVPIGNEIRAPRAITPICYLRFLVKNIFRYTWFHLEIESVVNTPDARFWSKSDFGVHGFGCKLDPDLNATTFAMFQSKIYSGIQPCSGQKLDSRSKPQPALQGAGRK